MSQYSQEEIAKFKEGYKKRDHEKMLVDGALITMSGFNVVDRDYIGNRHERRAAAARARK